MKNIIPYTKECTFNGKVAEITSISLEHSTKIEDGALKGNFIVSGDYKSHEISINKEPFEFDLPFEIELSENIDFNTIEFEITDFYYDLVNDSTLKVNIEFSVDAKEIETIQDERTPDIFKDIDEELEDPFELLMNSTVEEVKTTVIEEVVEEEKEAPREEAEEEIMEETKEKTKEEDEEKINIVREPEEIEEKREVDQITESTIVDSIKNDEDSYITYNIHIVRENETIDFISAKYGASIDELIKYNDITSVAIGDKIVIPALDTDE